MQYSTLENGDLRLSMTKDEFSEIESQIQEDEKDNADPDGHVYWEGWADDLYIEIVGCDPDNASAKTRKGHKVIVTVMDTFDDTIDVDED